MSPIERRRAILEYLNDHRQSTYKELAQQFTVSKNTIIADIEELTCMAPIFSISGNGGGIRVADGWSLYRRYLHNDQEALLRELMTGLQPDKQKTMQEILDAFAKPKVKERNS